MSVSVNIPTKESILSTWNKNFIHDSKSNLKKVPGFRNCRRDYYVIDSKTYELVEYSEAIE